MTNKLDLSDLTTSQPVERGRCKNILIVFVAGTSRKRNYMIPFIYRRIDIKDYILEKSGYRLRNL